jgi:uncharacterized protein (TIGR04255 family)
MYHSSQRPADLPEYLDPPLNEVLFGVQFSTPIGYQQIMAGEVWSKLFKEEYPVVAENLALQAQFETFGSPRQHQISFDLMAGAQHPRYWFINRSNDTLLQFQGDRFLHNWRKVPGLSNVYPRFETMFERFESELLSLEGFYSDLAPQQLECNQAEISYINHIELDESEAISDYIKIVSDKELGVEELVLAYKRVIESDGGKPIARLYSQIGPTMTPDGRIVLSLNLTVRGAPASPTISSSLELIKMGRRIIVNEFDMITTESAHKAWKKKT